METMRGLTTIAQGALWGLLAATVAVMSACGGPKSTGGTGNDPTGDSAQVAVRVSPARIARVEDRREFTGNVIPLEEVSISSGTPGRIANIRVDVGDRVGRGQLLVEMDSTALLTLRAQMLTQRLDFRRMDTLYRVGSVSQQQWNQTRTQYEITRAQVENLERNTRLTSSLQGVVTGRYYHAGELFTMTPSAISGGRAAILTVMQTDPIKISIAVPEGDLPKLRNGQKVSLRLDAYPDETFAGTVHRIAPTVDAASRTGAVEIVAPNANGVIKPGMYARIQLSLGERDRVLVKDLAVQHQRGTNEKYVFIDDNGTARRVVVTLGANIGDEYVILTGLAGTESIVTSGLQHLREGVRIRIVQ